MVDQPVLTPRYAVVSPYVSQYLLRQAGVDSQKVRKTAAWLRGMGRPDLAEQLVDGVRQLVLSAAEHRASVKGAGLPLAEVTEALAAEGGPELDVNEQITTTEAALMLGVSARRVTQLVTAEALCGRRVGRAWLVDSGSVRDLVEARGTA